MRRCLALLIALLGLWSSDAAARALVRVGGYEFPPFVETQGKAPSGLALDLIGLLNASQSSYEFQFVPTSARRRYADLQEGRYDLMMFESPGWGWSERGLPVDFSDVFLTGGEVYITQAEPGRRQDYFDTLAGKRLVGILGYHYGFAGFNDDPEVLAKNFNMKLVNNHRSSIEMVLAGRMDVAVVTDAYLSRHLAHNPEARNKLLVSERLDQAYHHRVLVRRHGPIDTAAVNKLLADLKKSGALDELWRKTGVR